MPTLDDVAAIANALPAVIEGERHGGRTWAVAPTAKKKNVFAWERPLTKADAKRWDDGPLPEGPIVAVRVEDLAEKEGVLAAGTTGIFDMQHFEGHPAVLIELRKVTKRALKEALVDGWLAFAPRDVAEEYLATIHRRR
ncbi:MAG TPA: hypothetical protein VM143_06155 [Acidimicrobiales bacterium]|nr:hypothetical protein [Acidimicrobiales bacterium]